jgi:hypothetical protein
MDHCCTIDKAVAFPRPLTDTIHPAVIMAASIGDVFFILLGSYICHYADDRCLYDTYMLGMDMT